MVDFRKKWGGVGLWGGVGGGGGGNSRNETLEKYWKFRGTMSLYGNFVGGAVDLVIDSFFWLKGPSRGPWEALDSSNAKIAHLGRGGTLKNSASEQGEKKKSFSGASPSVEETKEARSTSDKDYEVPREERERTTGQVKG